MTPRQETEGYIADTQARIREQIARISNFEATGRMEAARTARILLGAITDKLDALNLRLSAIKAGERAHRFDFTSPEPGTFASVSRVPDR